MTTYNLKPGQDIIVGDPNTINTFNGTLTAAVINQTGPTLNSNDILAGGTNSYNQLVISDDYGFGSDILPAGLQLSNIQEVDLNTAGNASGGVFDDASTQFDTRNISGDVLDVIQSSGGGNDNVTAAGTTTIEIVHSSGGGGVATTGGQNIGIITSGIGGVFVGGNGNVGLVLTAPTGSVVIQDSGTGNDFVNGGTNVTVYATGVGKSVDIGVATVGVTGTLAPPSGTIGVSAALGDTVNIGGGTAVGVAAAGAFVNIGFGGLTPTALSPSGDVAVTNFATTTYKAGGTNYATSVNGGNNVTVYTNAGDVNLSNTKGNVSVGEGSAAAKVSIGSGANVAVSAFGAGVQVGSVNGSNFVAPTGTVTVLDQASFLPAFDEVLNTHNQGVAIVGGSSVLVQTNVGRVTVGDMSDLVGANPTGDVTVVNAATGMAAFSHLAAGDAADVYGGDNVTVLALGGNIQVGGGTAAPGGALATDPTGTVSIDNAGQATGGFYNNHIDVYGGNGIGIITNGGFVTVGEDGAEAQGSVGIIDNFSGPNTDSFSVVGGSTISVTTTALQNSQSITIGDATPLVGAAGNVLSNAAAFATGNVVVVNETVIGGNAYLGDGSTTINTNGGTFVSVTGGNGATITDVETTPGTGAFAGSTIGTSTLSSVALNGVEGLVGITSDALAQLAIANTGGLDNFYDATSTGGVALRGATNVTVNETPAHTLALALANDVGLSVTDATATSVNVATVGTNPVVGGTVVAQGNDFQLTAGNATSLSFAGAGSVTLDNGLPGGVNASAIGNVATITATGSGAVNLGNLTADLKLTSINASAASGAVSVEINPNQTSFVGGSGNDVVTVDSNNFAKSGGGFNTVNGGTGANTIVANYVAAAGDTSLALLAPNFQTLQLGTNASSTAAANVYNATGFSNIVDASTNNVIVTNASTSATVGFSVNFATLTYRQASGGTNNSLTVNDGGFSGNTLNITGDSISTVTVNSTTTNPTSTTPGASLNLYSATNSVSTVKLTGNTDVSLKVAGGPASVTKIDASASSGKVDVIALTIMDAESHSGVSITGGSGLLTAAGVSDQFGSVSSGNDTLTTGSGGGVLSLGFGGEWVPGSAVPLVIPGYGTGSETVNLTASTGKVDTIQVYEGVQGAISSFNGTKGGVTGFQVTANSTTSDQLNYSTAKQVITNTTTATAVASIAGSATVLPPAGLTFTTSNGVITFSATAGGNVDAAFTQAQLVAAAELIVDAQGIDEIATFQSAGNTYVVASGHGGDEPTVLNNYNSVVELLGVTGVTGFGSTVGTAAGNAILGNVTQALYTPAMSGPVNAAGYSEVSLANASGTTPITGLGASGQIDITTASPGAITVSQVGTAGADSLIVNFTASSTVSNLTLNSDNAVTINALGNDMISKLVDGAGTLSTIDVTGAGAVTIGNFSTPGLTTIDAHTATGNLTIGSGATALASNGVHITGGSGALDTFYVNGANLVIDDHLAGSTFLSAFGSGDTINAGALTGPATDTFGGSAALVSGNNETITFNSGHLVAGGSNDQVTFSGAGAGFATVGLNATVTVSNAGIDSISVTGDVTGATSSGAFAFTTINAPAAPTTGAIAAQTHASINPAQLTINFNSTTAEHAAGGTSFAASLVNVAGLSSLGAAVDFAAHQALVLDAQHLFSGSGGNTTVTSGSTPVLQENAKTGLVDWFQYAGNTYIVEAVNNTSAAAAHAALGTGDVVVKLTGLVDLSNTHFLGHALHA